MGLYPPREESHLANQRLRKYSKNWYVDGYYGDDDASNPGDRPEKPLYTITEALDRCTAGQYDTIYVSRAAVIEATPIVVNKSSVRIIGDPYTVPGSAANCVVIATGDTDCFTFAAADISIEGFMLQAGATSAGVGFTAVVGGVRQRIEKCTFYTGAYGVLAPNAADSPSHYLSVLDCLFLPSGSTTGGISYGSNGSWPIFRGNFFEYVAAPNIYVWGSGHAGGRIENNKFMVSADAAGIAITIGANATRYTVADNCANNAAQDAITANPFVDTPGTSAWYRNVKSGTGYTDAEPT